MNTDVPWPDLGRPSRRYYGSRPSCTSGRPMILIAGSMTCYNLVCDPAVLVVAWARVQGRRGSRRRGSTASPQSISPGRRGSSRELRADLKARQFAPAAGAGTADPKAGRQAAAAGHPDRRGPGRAGGAQAGAGADLRGGFQAVSYGFRPRRRAQDAIAEIHLLHLLATTSGCSRRTSRRASTRSTTRP